MTFESSSALSCNEFSSSFSLHLTIHYYVGFSLLLLVDPPKSNPVPTTVYHTGRQSLSPHFFPPSFLSSTHHEYTPPNHIPLKSLGTCHIFCRNNGFIITFSSHMSYLGKVSLITQLYLRLYISCLLIHPFCNLCFSPRCYKILRSLVHQPFPANSIASD